MPTETTEMKQVAGIQGLMTLGRFSPAEQNVKDINLPPLLPLPLRHPHRAVSTITHLQSESASINTIKRTHTMSTHTYSPPPEDSDSFSPLGSQGNHELRFTFS